MSFIYCRNNSCFRFRDTIIASEIDGFRSLVKYIYFSLTWTIIAIDDGLVIT